MKILQRRYAALAVTLVILCPLIGAGPVKAAVVMEHTGVDVKGSGCGAGTGAVEVILTRCEFAADGSAIFVAKEFQQIVEHAMRFDGIKAGGVVFQEAITNQTGIAWTDFHFSFDGVSKLQFEPSVGDRFEIVDNMLWLFFGKPVPSGRTFSLSIVFAVEGTAYKVSQYPTISAVPLPAALPLFLSALAGLGFVGRRRRQADA